jgi:rfaE bifunctional protein kinase chain/domain
MSPFLPKKILVAGDLILDVYAYGKVKRISPEAPVPVLNLERYETVPGGAGNTLLNLIALGMEVTALGRVGEDRSGVLLLENLIEAGVSTEGVLVDPDWITPEKTRCIAQSHQLLRIDRESIVPLDAQQEARVLEQIPSLLKSCDLVAISDYAKGFLTLPILGCLISESKKREIPVIVDPKGVDFTRYTGASILKPNLMEAILASGLPEETSLEEIARAVIQKSQIENLIVTRSEQGISLFSEKERYDIPAHTLDVTDVTGAGDTVLAVLSAAVANGLSLKEGLEYANYAASLAVQHLGCARISIEELSTFKPIMCEKS